MLQRWMLSDPAAAAGGTARLAASVATGAARELWRRRLCRPHTPWMHPKKSVFLCYLSPPSFRLHVPLSFHISTLLNLLSQVVCHQDEAALLPNFRNRGWNWVFLTNFNTRSLN